MKSYRLPARLRPLILALLLPAAALSACASRPVIYRPASNCSTLVPEEWGADVPSADLPSVDDIGHWIAFGDAQTGQLDKSNDRTRSSLSIVRKCEARDAETMKALEGHPWWKFWG